MKKCPLTWKYVKKGKNEFLKIGGSGFYETLFLF